MNRITILKSFTLSLFILFFISTITAYAESVDETLEKQGQQFVNFMEDGVITAQVIAKIVMDKGVADLKIDVTTEHGTVFLSGVVDAKTQENKLIELVSSTPGVKKVDASKLLVKESQHPIEDWMISTKIRSLFLKEKLWGNDISAMSIAIETNNGNVFLSGTADSPQQVDNAVALAKTVNGVVHVVSDIRVITKKNGNK